MNSEDHDLAWLTTPWTGCILAGMLGRHLPNYCVAAALLLSGACSSSSGPGTSAKPLPVTSAIVDSALHYFADSFDLPPSCAGSVTVNCGTGSSPIPIPLTITAYTITRRASPDTLVFDWVADVKVISPAIPVTIPAPTGSAMCTLNVDTRPGIDSTVHTTGTATFSPQETGGPISRLDVTGQEVTGLSDADVSLSGSFLCDAADVTVDFVTGTISDLLAADLHLCSVRGPRLFEVCLPE